MHITGAEIIVENLRANDCDHVFALCGHGNIGLLDALYHAQDDIKTVSVHHEQVAGHMADAYYRVAGRAAATLTSCGPGSANLPVALASAMMDSSAVMTLTGNVPTQQFNRDAFQETGRHFQGDFPSVLRPYVKRSFQPTRVEQLPLVMHQAFSLMKSGRPGPVHVDVPLNLFKETEDVDVSDAADYTKGLSSRSGVDPAGLQTAIDLLLAAERPVLLLGGGIHYHQAIDELTAFIDRCGIPVVGSPEANGALPSDHPLWFGPIGRNGSFAANEACRHADVILSISCLLDDRMTSAWQDGFTFSIPPTSLIQVDIDPRELSKNYPATVGLLGHPATALTQFATEWSRQGFRRPESWIRRLEDCRRQWNADVQEGFETEGIPVHPQRLVRELRDAIPADVHVLSDVGIHHNWLVQYWDILQPGTFHQSWGFASMGFGVAGVLGAHYAQPDKPAVTICGDAGFAMVSSAVLTAVENDIPAVWVVWDNQAYGSIRDMQYGFFEGRELATAFYRDGEPFTADFAALARAYGASGVTIESEKEIGDAVDAAVKSGKPTVVHVPTRGDVKPIATGGWVLPPLAPITPSYGYSGAGQSV